MNEEKELGVGRKRTRFPHSRHVHRKSQQGIDKFVDENMKYRILVAVFKNAKDKGRSREERRDPLLL